MKYWLVLVGIGLAGGLSLAYTSLRQPDTVSHCTSPTTLTMPNNETILVELATTPEQREQGLANRAMLAPRHGMLFYFPNPGRHTFWMKDTRIPLDIVWFRNSIVTEIISLDPANNTAIPTHTPSEPATTVLEINKGEAQSLGLTAGSKVELPACTAR